MCRFSFIWQTNWWLQVAFVCITLPFSFIESFGRKVKISTINQITNFSFIFYDFKTHIWFCFMSVKWTKKIINKTKTEKNIVHMLGWRAIDIYSFASGFLPLALSRWEFFLCVCSLLCECVQESWLNNRNTRAVQSIGHIRTNRAYRTKERSRQKKS